MREMRRRKSATWTNSSRKEKKGSLMTKSPKARMSTMSLMRKWKMKMSIPKQMRTSLETTTRMRWTKVPSLKRKTLIKYLTILEKKKENLKPRKELIKKLLKGIRSEKVAKEVSNLRE